MPWPWPWMAGNSVWIAESFWKGTDATYRLSLHWLETQGPLMSGPQIWAVEKVVGVEYSLIVQLIYGC